MSTEITSMARAILTHPYRNTHLRAYNSRVPSSTRRFSRLVSSEYQLYVTSMSPDPAQIPLYSHTSEWAFFRRRVKSLFLRSVLFTQHVFGEEHESNFSCFKLGDFLPSAVYKCVCVCLWLTHEQSKRRHMENRKWFLYIVKKKKYYKYR